MKPGGLFSKLFFTSYFFTIALREKRGKGIEDETVFHPQMVIPARKNDWVADPMLAEEGERTWLFYEAVRGEKGRIEVVEILEGCRVSEPKVILEDSCHYSYPFVFKIDSKWYMIPESSAAKEVRLYRANSFPFEWELQTVLLHECAVDTTVFKWQGEYWLLTFLTDQATERVFPKAYIVQDWEQPVLKKVEWTEYDPLRVRGAGPAFPSEQGLMRPAQISQLHRYGDGLVFYRPFFTDKYVETAVFEISEQNLRVKGVFADGLHTYCCSSKYEAIDVRCRVFEPFKVVKRMLHK